MKKLLWKVVERKESLDQPLVITLHLYERDEETGTENRKYQSWVLLGEKEYPAASTMKLGKYYQIEFSLAPAFVRPEPETVNG